MSLDEFLVDDLTHFADVFTLALRGHPCRVHHDDGRSGELPVHRWRAVADRADDAFLAHCTGASLDIGCGPGRMAARLVERGHPALGLDVVEEAVRLTRSRGASAMLLDVFEPVPGEGEWETAILIDGNIGIGGDPHALLTRIRRILRPGGRLVVEVDPPGTGHRRSSLVLSAGGRSTGPLRWAEVGADAIAALALDTGFMLDREPHAHGDRWCAVLEVAS